LAKGKVYALILGIALYQVGEVSTAGSLDEAAVVGVLGFAQSSVDLGIGYGARYQAVKAEAFEVVERLG
jgi:hypothetical protein